MSSQPYTGDICFVGENFAPQPSFMETTNVPQSIKENTVLFSLYGTMYGGDGRVTFGIPDFKGRIPFSKGTCTGMGVSFQIGEKGGNVDKKLSVSEMPEHSHVAALSDNSITGQSDFQAPDYIATSNVTEGTVTPSGSLMATNRSAGTSTSPSGQLLAHSGIYNSYDAGSQVAMDNHGIVMNTTPVTGTSVSTTVSLDPNNPGGVSLSNMKLASSNVNVQDNGGGSMFSLIQPYQTVLAVICHDGIYPRRS